MNLNKPPISEEQNALEEYVDFLLTDRSNVTPINRKISLTKKLHDNKIDLVNESVGEIIGLNLSPIDKESNKDTRKKTLQQAAETSSELVPQANQATQKTNLEKVEDFTDESVNRCKKNEIPDKKRVTNFIPESEEEELKKWDAILTKEKELNILGLEAEAKNRDLSKAPNVFQAPPENTKSNQKLAEKNEYLLRQKELEISRITSDRPAVFDEPLPLKEPDERLASVEKLLSRISLATKPSIQMAEDLKTELMTPEPDLLATETINEISEESVQATFLPRPALKTKDMLPSVFQTLIFNVGKLPLAVPLLKLGGIVHISEKVDITPLVGTPDWFMGLVPHERGNLMVIDTQKYLMPEKVDYDSTQKPYEYLIILDDSNWAIACHTVGEAKNLTQDDIRWSAKSSKRPWFGGMVVQYMSAIIEVDELINMLASNITD